jgi:hypothetical protein
LAHFSLDSKAPIVSPQKFRCDKVDECLGTARSFKSISLSQYSSRFSNKNLQNVRMLSLSLKHLKNARNSKQKSLKLQARVQHSPQYMAKIGSKLNFLLCSRFD